MISEGLMQSLNAIRDTSIQNNTLYHTQVPVVEPTTSIQNFGMPILQDQQIMNEFVHALMNRIAYTMFSTRYTFVNPLRILEGDEIPLGQSVQDIYVNPAQARQYDVNDFAGLLVKYESDVKVQYLNKNVDLQYCVSITRPSLKKAFTSWGDLERFIDELANSLYNGCYIDDFARTKALVSTCFRDNYAQIEVVTEPTDEATGRAFAKTLRTLYLNMALPSVKYNAWAKVGGNGNAIKTWTPEGEAVFLIRNDVLANIDVDVLAVSFNMDKADLLGRIIPVDNFDILDNGGNVVFDGSAILGFIGDRRWFRIHQQEMYLDEFYNANNRVWNYYLNKIAMYNYSLFANGIIIATEEPNVEITALSFNSEALTIGVGSDVFVKVESTPFTGNTEITYTSSNNKVTIEKIDNKTIKVSGASAGTGTITATAGNVTATVDYTVSE